MCWRALRACLGIAIAAVILIAGADLASAQPPDASTALASPYASWPNGPDRQVSYFPVAVWLQNPKLAPQYQALGVNLYIGLWKGPTAEQLAELQKHAMPVICSQNDYALAHRDEKIMVAWMHGDEPDNAQPLRTGNGYGPPILPEKIAADYQRIKARDPSRPVLLNLGQGVAWDAYYGRGVRSNHPEDYPQYLKGCDIASFDIYPAVHEKSAVAGKLWYVARGVDRLRQWAGREKPVWNCIECTRISNVDKKPTPGQVKAEVWMSILHGSQGIIYFCHQFKPQFSEAALLADNEMARAVGEINREIHNLARVINSPTVPHGVAIRCEPEKVSPELAQAVPSGPVAALVKRSGGVTYLFTVRMEDGPAKATFELPGRHGPATVEVLGENRTIAAINGTFADAFAPYAVHLYRIAD